MVIHYYEEIDIAYIIYPINIYNIDINVVSIVGLL